MGARLPSRCGRTKKSPPISGSRDSSKHRDSTQGTQRAPMYDPDLVRPMRDELTSLGVKELLTPQDVDAVVKKPGTTLIFVNSVCGCAAGGARPGLRLSLMHKKKPDNMVTVFAGMETQAVEKAREYFKPYRPSSPQMELFDRLFERARKLPTSAEEIQSAMTGWIERQDAIDRKRNHFLKSFRSRHGFDRIRYGPEATRELEAGLAAINAEEDSERRATAQRLLALER